MKCPTCGNGNLVHGTRNRPYTYKGKSTTIRNVTGRFCDNPDCRDVVLEMAESVRTAREMLAFNKKINAGLTPVDLLANVRQRLKLTQQQAARVFGGGPNAFSRYESGKTKPPVALVKLFGILDKHPHLYRDVANMKVATQKSANARAVRATAKVATASSRRKRRAGVRVVHA